MHRDYIKKHKPVVFAALLTIVKLWQYLADNDRLAEEMYKFIIKQIKEAEGKTE